MVQFRRHDNAHWYHETQRSGSLEIVAAQIADASGAVNSSNLDYSLPAENVPEKGIFLLGCVAGMPDTFDDAFTHHTPILLASEAMYHALFPTIVEPDHNSTFSLYDRLSSALTVAQVTGVQRLCSHYAERLTPLPSPDASRESNMRLTQITQYARQLASQPTLIDQHALQQLADVGLTHTDIIVLSQIIGFIGYQARVVAGVSALAGYPTVMLPGFPRMDDAIAVQLPNANAIWQGWLPGWEENTTLTEEELDDAELTLEQLLAYHQQSLPAYREMALQLYHSQRELSDAALTGGLEWVSLVSARINGSRYCQAQHQQKLQQIAGNAPLLAALQVDVDGALAAQSSGTVTHSLISVAAELTRAPERFSYQHLSPLLTLGINYNQVLSLLFNTAAAGWTNRLRQTLGHVD